MPDQPPTIALDAIRQREQAATEGPWRAAWPNGLHPWEVCISADVPLVELAHGEQGIADAEFIAAAREDVPALLAEVDRLAFQLEHAQVDATAYRDLADALQATMTDPDRWDGDEAEIAIMLRYVQHLAAERDKLAAELATLKRHASHLFAGVDAAYRFANKLDADCCGTYAQQLRDAIGEAGTAPVPGSSRRAQEGEVTRHQWREDIRAGGEALALLGPRATVWAGSSAVLNAAVPLLAGEALTVDEAAAGDVGKCPQCGKQTRSYRRGCSWCGFGRPASDPDAPAGEMREHPGTGVPTEGIPADLEVAQPERHDPSTNCYCGGPEEIYPHKQGTGRYCRPQVE